jgi:hypothetical protein
MENKIPNLHVLRIKYLGATNTRGSRVKITSDRFKQSVTIPFDHALNNIEDMAVAYLEHRNDPNGFHIVGIAEGYVVTDTFQPLKV